LLELFLELFYWVCDILRKKTIEDYAELVYNLEKVKSPVHTNDIANELGINPASVTEIFQKLSKEGYINYEKYTGVTITKKGKKIALQIKNKHKVLKDFLMFLGLDEKNAERDACEMEHILHSETMDLITKFVDFIKNCDMTPFWLQRFKKYVETDQLTECPPEIAKLCNRLSIKGD